MIITKMITKRMIVFITTMATMATAKVVMVVVMTKTILTTMAAVTTIVAMDGGHIHAMADTQFKN